MNKILVVVDLENVTFHLFKSQDKEVDPSDVFAAAVEKIKAIGQVYGIFLFLPPHSEPKGSELLRKTPDCFMVVCPREISEGISMDTVDKTIKKFCEKVVTQMPDITHLCLFTGDKDYIPMLETLKKEGLKIMIVGGEKTSLSPKLKRVADKYPRGNKEMVFLLTP